MSNCMADYGNDDSYERQGQYSQPIDRNGNEVNRYHEYEYVVPNGRCVRILSHNFPYHTERHRSSRACYAKKYASGYWF